MEGETAISRQRKHTKKRLGDGKCAYGGCSNDPEGHYHCPEHSLAHKERMRAWRKARKDRARFA